MPRGEQCSPARLRLQQSATLLFRFWRHAKRRRWKRFVPLWINHFQRRSSSRSRPINGKGISNASNSTARSLMHEIQETTYLKDLWNEEHARTLGDNQLVLLRYRSNLLGADL